MNSRIDARRSPPLAAMQSENQNYDAAILIGSAFGLIGLAAIVYAFARRMGIEDQIIALLTAVMP